MAKLSLIGLAMCCLLVAAHAASFTCDDARRIGNPKNNQCGALCTEVVRQNPALKKLSGFCKSQCQQCVVAVSRCRQGARQPMPGVCAQAFRVPAVMKVVNTYMAKTNKSGARGL